MNNDDLTCVINNSSDQRTIGKTEKSTSKWRLLRSALLGGRRDHSSSTSIHRFQALNHVLDFQTLSKEKVDTSFMIFIYHNPKEYLHLQVSKIYITLRYRIFPQYMSENCSDYVNLIVEDMQNLCRYPVSPPSVSSAVRKIVQECEQSMRETFHVDECRVCISVEQSVAMLAFAVSSFVDSCINECESSRYSSTSIQTAVSGI